MTYRNVITALVVSMIALGAASAQQAPAADKKAPAPAQQLKAESKPDSSKKTATKSSKKKGSKAKSEAGKDSTKDTTKAAKKG